MKVKIATWNMDNWKREAEIQKKAWEYLDEVISPDIALVQEAVPISSQMGFIGTGKQPTGSFIDNETVVWQEIGGSRKWGSGVLTKSFPLREVHFNNSHQGSVIVAEVLLPNNSVWTCISLYGLLDNGYATTTLHRILSDLTFLLHEKMGKRQFIVGGDLNISPQWDEQYPEHGFSHRNIFDRLTDFGLVNCLEKFHTDPIQTMRHPKSDFPWQNDYVFANKELIDSLISCDVVNDPEVSRLSDHNPVVAIFDVK
ncbi:MAG: endonuclease/exonuclease/phosphatase family protein [Planctomycetota bacterium]|jgi:exonuclease III